MILCMPPAPLHRIGVRRVCWEVEGLDPGMGRKECLYDLGRMDSSSIPNQLDVARDFPANLAEEINDPASVEVHVGRKHPEEKPLPLRLRGNRDGPYRRNLVPAVPCRKDRRLSTRSKGSSAGGHHLKAHLVQIDQGRLVRFGFFLISGSFSWSQFLTTSGFRSRAIFSGRWKDQPNFSVTRR